MNVMTSTQILQNSIHGNTITDPVTLPDDYAQQVFQTSINSPVNEAKGHLSLTNVFRISNFVVTKVLVRRVTTSEVWAAIGGLWAGSMLLIGILFVTSGHTSNAGRDVMIFRCIPSSWRESGPLTTTSSRRRPPRRSGSPCS